MTGMKEIYIRTYPDGMQYVGQTVNAKGRQRDNRKSSVPVEIANRKFKGRVKTQVLLICEDYEADYYERKVIEVYGTLWPNGYNMQSGGNKGYQVCEETGRKISEAMKGDKHPNYGKKNSDETRRKMSVALKGRKHSDETRQKISDTMKGTKNPFYGKRHSEEAKRKMSETRKKYWKDKK